MNDVITMRSVPTSFSSTEYAPLVVNVLRLIRNGRSSDYRDHEHGPMSFPFASLQMRDSGPYHAAEKVWAEAASHHAAHAEYNQRRASTAHTHMRSNSRRSDGNAASDDVAGSYHGSSFAGPLYLTVYMDGAMVERWMVEDFREHHTENTIPSSCDQLESLNSLVRIVYTHLRMQEIYSEVVNRCTSSVSAGAAQSDADTLAPRARHDLVRSAGLQLVVSSDVNRAAYRCPTAAEEPGGGVLRRRSSGRTPLPARAYCREEMWAVSDLVRVRVRSNALWRSQMRLHSPRVDLLAHTTSIAPANANAAAAAAKGVPVSDLSTTSYGVHGGCAAHTEPMGSPPPPPLCSSSRRSGSHDLARVSLSRCGVKQKDDDETEDATQTALASATCLSSPRPVDDVARLADDADGAGRESEDLVRQMYRIFDPRCAAPPCRAHTVDEEGAESMCASHGLTHFEIGSMAVVEPRDNTVEPKLCMPSAAAASLVPLPHADVHNDEDIYTILCLCDGAGLMDCTPGGPCETTLPHELPCSIS